MTTTGDPRVSRWSFLGRLGGNPVLLWSAFILAHLWLGILNLYADGHPLGDVTTVYKFWTDQAVVAHYWVGIDSSWVYPIVAMVPMLLARLFGPALYASTWLSLVMLVNAVAFGFITGWGRNRLNATVAWWWVAFLFLLGPIALGRIDSITVPLAIVGVLLVATRPRVASVVLTVAAWIKVWPGALLVALIIATKARRPILGAAIATSLAIIATALAFGSGLNVFSFVTEQTTRGLQIEAPVSTIWLWQALGGAPATYIYYDQSILTFQMTGSGAELASSLMTPLLLLVTLAIALLAILAVRNRAPVTEILPALALALVTALIAVNKVGSPQFMTWLAVPVILGLATSATGHGRSFRVPAILVAVLAALTQSFYPYLYGRLLALDPVVLILLTARNLLLFVLLGWALAVLWRAARPSAWHEDLVGETGWLPEVWPFGPGRDLDGATVESAPQRDSNSDTVNEAEPTT
ncbi:MAG: glycosyltransferase family 87 protein [Lacisediminihabitans sp.]